jgi:hypothetical protein
MTREKKEEKRKYKERTKNMSLEDKETYDQILTYQNRFERLLNEFHRKLFSEEYDFMLDDNVDSSRRARGENPMSKEYIEKMDQKRISYGIQPLSENGYPKDNNESFEYCKKLITKDIEFLK